MSAAVLPEDLSCCGLSRAMEDYLKALVHLAEVGEVARNGTIASRVGVSAPSVSIMLQRLRDGGLVVRGSGGEVQLTPHGRQHALRVVRRHRLVETFLVEVLNLGWDEIHEEAERLEHALSPLLEDRIARLLGDPEEDPHGDPIPPRDGHDVIAWPSALRCAPAGSLFRVERVSDRDAALLRGLAAIDVVPGTLLRVLEGSGSGGGVGRSGSAPEGGMRIEANGGIHELDVELIGIVHGSIVQG